MAQALFWACLVGAMNLMFIGSELPPSFLLRSSFIVATIIVLILLNTYCFFPCFFFEKRYGAFVAAVFLGLLGMILLNEVMEFWMPKDLRAPFPNASGLSKTPMPKPPKMVINPRYFMGLVVYTAVVMVSTVLESIQLHRQQERLSNQVEREKLTAELKFLKSQINPHFLFNVLNNVYSLSIAKSEQTPEVVIRLSEMLRYMLYQSGHERASLEQEIVYIQNYTALQQLKDDEQLSVELELEVKNPSARIAPMILIPFVENAFKHSKIEDISHGWIKVRLTEQGNQFVFEVRNSLPGSSFTKDPTGGIGLSNVKRRLELEYPGKHQLDIREAENAFTIQLSVSLI